MSSLFRGELNLEFVSLINLKFKIQNLKLSRFHITAFNLEY
jgi:hypothetical protein